MSLQVNSYIVAAHHFDDAVKLDGGTDVYIITNKCILNGTSTERKHSYEHGSYTSRVRELVMHWRNYTYPVNGADVDEFFNWKAFIRSSINGLTEGSEIVLHEPRPEAVNRVTNHKFSHGWHVGGEIKVSTESSNKGGEEETKDSKSIAINGGYNSSTEEGYSTTDMNTELIKSKQTDFKWYYYATRVPEQSSPTWSITRPAELSTSTYSPAHAWVWTMPTSARPKYDTYNLEGIFEIGGVYSRNSGSISPANLCVGPQKNGRQFFRSAAIKLPKPPLFAFDKYDAIISKKGSDVQMLIFSQGDWTWNTADVPS